MTESNKPERTQPIVTLNDGEFKKIVLGYRRVDGKVEITLASQGFDDDINEIAVMLAYTLEHITGDTNE